MKIMHTMASEARPKVSKRRFYSPEFKLPAVGECGQAGASIAAVALKRGVNANIVHRWLREHSQGTLAVQQLAFMPVTLTAQPTSPPPQSELPTPPDIRIEVHRANTTVVVNWPLQGGAACAQWLREWLA
jgi:transposase